MNLMLNPFILYCNFCACKCVCTVVVRFPRGGLGTVTWGPSLGDRHLVTVPEGVEEEEEEEERLPRSHGRWASASSPGGPTQTRQGSPPSYLRKSKTDLAAHLRTLLPVGRPCPSAGVRQRHGLIYLRVPVTNRPKALDPPESASQSRPAREGVGLPGASPPT